MTLSSCENDNGLAEMQRMLLIILNATDNDERRTTQAAVIHLLATPSNQMLLVQTLEDIHGVTPGVRQLAAVLLRKKVLSLWRAISLDMQVELKRILLLQLGVEPVRVVRFAVAHLVSRLAKADALESPGGWPELQHAIRAAVDDPRTEIRELSMVLAYGIAEVLDDSPSLGLLVVEAVLQGMMDAEDCVQRAAVKAAGALLFFLLEHDQECKQMLQALTSRCIDLLATYSALESKASLSVDVLNLIEQLIGVFGGKKHNSLFRSLGHALLPVFIGKGNVPRVRQSCSEALVMFVDLKPKFVTSTFLESFVDACMQVMGEDSTISFPEVAHMEGSDGDGYARQHCGEGNNMAEDMLDVSSSCMYAVHLLSTMATRISSGSFTPVLISFVTGVVENTHSDPLACKAAIIALACLAESNPGYLRRRVKYVLQLTQKFLQDNSPVVREAAAFALTYFCLNLEPEISTHHQLVFGMLAPLLCDCVDEVRRRVAQALDTLFENMGEEVEPYVPLVLPSLLEAIGCSSIETQKGLCGVISSLAMTRSPSFLAHAAQCLEMLKTPLVVESPETILLRAKVIEAAGIIANAVGKEAFMPHLSFFMECVANNLRTRQTELREESFGFLSNVCETLQSDFMPYLDDSINCAMQTISEDRTHHENKQHLAEGVIHSFNMNGDNDDDNDDDDGDDEENTSDDSKANGIFGSVRTADVEEKSSAVHFIGVCAEVLLANFGAARIDACWALLTDIEASFHPSVLCSVLVALAKLTKAAHASDTVVKSIEQDTLTPYTRQLLNTLVNDVLLLYIREETEKEIVASACEAFEILFNFFGPQVVYANADPFVKTTVALLQQRMPCQESFVDDQDDAEDEGDCDGGAFGVHSRVDCEDDSNGEAVELTEGHDKVLIDTVCDMIESFAKAYGPSFRTYSDAILPPLLRYAADDRSSEDVLMAMGCIATIMESMGQEAESYLDSLLNLALHLIKSTDESTVRANCAYLIRVFVENCVGRFDNTAATAPLLEALWSITNSDEEIPSAVDNAVSATCSMLRCLSPSLIPLQSVVPVLLQRIPMQVDRTENANAIKALLHLLTKQREFVRVHSLAGVVQCVATVLASRTVDEEQKWLLVAQGVSPFVEACRQEWRTASGFLHAELQNAMERYRCY